MDRFYKNDSRLYCMLENQYYVGVINTYPSTAGILAENFVEDVPEIQLASQLLWEESSFFTVGNTFEKEKGRFA